jgi:hypothetical protein
MCCQDSRINLKHKTRDFVSRCPKVGITVLKSVSVPVGWYLQPRQRRPAFASCRHRDSESAHPACVRESAWHGGRGVSLGLARLASSSHCQPDARAAAAIILSELRLGLLNWPRAVFWGQSPGSPSCSHCGHHDPETRIVLFFEFARLLGPIRSRGPGAGARWVQRPGGGALRPWFMTRMAAAGAAKPSVQRQSRGRRRPRPPAVTVPP